MIAPWRDSPLSGNGHPQEIGDEIGQRSRLERLRDEADATGSDEPVRIRGGAGRERDHGDAPGRGIAFQRFDDRQAIHLGHMVVDEDQVGMLRSGQRQPVPTSRRLEDLMAMGTEQLGERTQDEVIVVDDQDRAPRCGSRLKASGLSGTTETQARSPGAGRRRRPPAFGGRPHAPRSSRTASGCAGRRCVRETRAFPGSGCRR